MFLINYQYFRSYVIFWLNFDTLQNIFEACHYNPITPGILFDMHLWLHKVLLSEKEGIRSYNGFKKSCSRYKKHDIIWKMSLTHKPKQRKDSLMGSPL